MTAERKTRMPKDKTLGVSMDAEMRGALTTWAKRTGKSEAWVARALMQVGMQNIPGAVREALQREMDEALAAANDTHEEPPRGSGR
jgi:hypothetical protein